MPSPWLRIIGIGEDGLAGLSQSSRDAIAAADVLFGGPRHIALAQVADRATPWSVPFDCTPILAQRGRQVVVLASGDPFWYGAGTAITKSLAPDEWISHPGPSTFSLAASALGWPIERTICIALHAAAFNRLVPVLSNGARIVCLVRDGESAIALAQWLNEQGWGTSRLWSLSALGGPRQHIAQLSARALSTPPPPSPVAVAIEACGGKALGRSAGLPDDLFQNDGQLTKRPLRALAMCALSPKPDELLWDIGAGCGSISVEWALAGGRAVAIEHNPNRIGNVRANIEKFGIEHRIEARCDDALSCLEGLEKPDAVFVGGGLSAALWDKLSATVAPGTRIVAHAVTLESEAFLAHVHARSGGEMFKFDIAQAEPLGRMRSWKPYRTVTQLRTTL